MDLSPGMSPLVCPDRLKEMSRGDLNTLKSEIENLKFAQDWALDATGNWRSFREDDDGAGWALNQQRTANKVNEITDIAETLGVSWVTPVYSKAGNMTTMPKPADPTAAFYATYDAWNRLVKIEEDDGMSGTWTVAEYEYDGAQRRNLKEVYASGALDETRHLYYTEPDVWQVVEERVGSSSDAERQFVWGLRYVDEIVERDHDTSDDATLDQRLYGVQDGNWNVTGLVDTIGNAVERYLYDAYGEMIYFDGSFGNGRNRSSTPPSGPSGWRLRSDVPSEGRQAISVRIKTFRLPLDAKGHVRLPFLRQIHAA